jgi:acetolactate synthase I/II/III large subunit
MYTASTAFLEALTEAGISYLFANFGSDHPGIIESLAEAAVTGRPVPQVITCPNEMVALSCAHGYAQVSGRPQAVLVHVECGTQALAGAVHNAARCRIPVLIFAGASPFTQEGELRGSRNEFIHWLQDVFDQRGIVRGYTKYAGEVRTGRNIKQMVFRALQFARSDPQGPVYLMGAREVMEEEIPPSRVAPTSWAPIEPAALHPRAVAELAAALAGARRPLIVTSYLGRNARAVTELVQLAFDLGIGVLESVPSYLNFPSGHPLYQGNLGNEPIQHPALAEADVILVIDSDVPWIPAVNRPSVGATLFHVDVDPIKEQMPLWYLHGARPLRADAATALSQLNEYLQAMPIDAGAAVSRRAHYADRSHERRQKLAERELPREGVTTPEYLTARVRAQLASDGIVLNEGITNYTAINDHIGATLQGTRLTSGGSSLGWHGGAAIGAKLACPEREVVCLAGDGSYLFSQPSTVYWMARQHHTPFLTVIYNNRGWKAPKLSALAVYPDGYASRASDLPFSFDPPPDYAAIAAACGAFGRIVKDPADLDTALRQAFQAVRDEKRCAVVDVWLDAL